MAGPLRDLFSGLTWPEIVWPDWLGWHSWMGFVFNWVSLWLIIIAIVAYRIGYKEIWYRIWDKWPSEFNHLCRIDPDSGYVVKLGTAKEIAREGKSGPAANILVEGPVKFAVMWLPDFKFDEFGCIVPAPGTNKLSIFRYKTGVASKYGGIFFKIIDAIQQMSGLVLLWPLKNVAEIRNRWQEIKRDPNGKITELIEKEVWQRFTLITPVSEAIQFDKLYDAGNIEFYVIAEYYYRIFNLLGFTEFIQDPKGKVAGILRDRLRSFFKKQNIYQEMLGDDAAQKTDKKDILSRLAEDFLEHLEEIPENGLKQPLYKEIIKEENYEKLSAIDKIKRWTVKFIDIRFYVVGPVDEGQKRALSAKRVAILTGEANKAMEQKAYEQLLIRLNGAKAAGAAYSDPNVRAATLYQAIADFVKSEKPEASGINTLAFARIAWDMAGGLLSKEQINAALTGAPMTGVTTKTNK